jgi:hypothetical protein
VRHGYADDVTHLERRGEERRSCTAKLILEVVPMPLPCDVRRYAMVLVGGNWMTLAKPTGVMKDALFCPHQNETSHSCKAEETNNQLRILDTLLSQTVTFNLFNFNLFNKTEK